MKLRINILCIFICLCHISALAQNDGAVRVNPEDRVVDMDNPTFVPMVKVGKVMKDGDSIQYVELNNIYVYINATNLFTVAHLDGMGDPEMNALTNYPITKTCNVGLKVTF